MSVRSVVFLAICFLIAHECYKLPKVEFLIHYPKGLKASIPVISGVTKFAMILTINDDYANTTTHEASDITEGRLIIEDNNISLVKDDVINYFVMVIYNGYGYTEDDLTFKVDGYNPKDSAFNSLKSSADFDCKQSITIVGDKNMCQGEVIFEENFIGDVLDNKKWIVEHRLPKKNQEEEFVSYQHSSVIVDSEKLKITPTLYVNSPNYNRSFVDLRQNCTGDLETECIAILHQHVSTLPPVISGKISTRDRFSFKYGTIEIKAKLPQGDWIYPELYLEPAKYKYGKEGYESGMIRIAFTRGNLIFHQGLYRKYTNYELTGGVIFHQFEPCRLKRIETHSNNTTPWGNDFHVYGLTWDDESMKFFVDNVEYGAIVPPNGGFGSFKNDPTCASGGDDSFFEKWGKGSIMAPFDDEFHITLGIGVGGISDFPSHLGGFWNRSENIRLKEFVKLQNNWYNTWRNNKQLIVDSVKITAL